jgi:cell division protein FtsX
MVFLAALVIAVAHIRLMTQTRAVGLDQMRLLGAGRVSLALPFMFEGMILSAGASGLGWVAIVYGLGRVIPTPFELVVPAFRQIAVFIGACTLLGLASGYLGIRRLLR